MPKKYSIEECKNYCAKWRASGLSKTSFCKANDISEAALYRWLKLYAEGFAQPETKELKFLAIEAVTQNELKRVEVVLPNGVLLRREVESLSKLVWELSR